MTRKDFITIAACIRVQQEDGNADPASARAIAEAFALEAKLDNPRFDRARFLTACGRGLLTMMQLVLHPIGETWNRPRRTFMRGSAGDVEAHWFDLIELDGVGGLDMFYVDMCEADDSEVVHIDGLSPAR